MFSQSGRRKRVISMTDSDSEDDIPIADFFSHDVALKQGRYGQMPPEWRTSATLPFRASGTVVDSTPSSNDDIGGEDIVLPSRLLDDVKDKSYSSVSEPSSEEELPTKKKRKKVSSSTQISQADESKSHWRENSEKSRKKVSRNSPIDASTFTSEVPEEYVRRFKRIRKLSKRENNIALRTPQESKSEANESRNGARDEKPIHSNHIRTMQTRLSSTEEQGTDVFPQASGARTFIEKYLEIPEADYSTLLYPVEVPQFDTPYAKREITNEEGLRKFVKQARKYNALKERNNARRRREKLLAAAELKPETGLLVGNSSHAFTGSIEFFTFPQPSKTELTPPYEFREQSGGNSDISEKKTDVETSLLLTAGYKQVIQLRSENIQLKYQLGELQCRLTELQKENDNRTLRLSELESLFENIRTVKSTTTLCDGQSAGEGHFWGTEGQRAVSGPHENIGQVTVKGEIAAASSDEPNPFFNPW